MEMKYNFNQVLIKKIRGISLDIGVIFFYTIK